MNRTLRSLLVVPAMLVALSVAPKAHAADDSFLQVDGMMGDSTDARFKGAFAIRSFGFTGSAPVSVAGATTNVGKGQLGQFVVTKALDASTPKFIQALMTGQVFKKITFTVMRPTSTSAMPVPAYRVTLENAALASVKQTHTNGDTPGDELAFAFGRVTIEWLAPGAALPKFTWDVAQARSF